MGQFFGIAKPDSFGLGLNIGNSEKWRGQGVCLSPCVFVWVLAGLRLLARPTVVLNVGPYSF